MMIIIEAPQAQEEHAMNVLTARLFAFLAIVIVWAWMVPTAELRSQQVKCSLLDECSFRCVLHRYWVDTNESANYKFSPKGIVYFVPGSGFIHCTNLPDLGFPDPLPAGEPLTVDKASGGDSHCKNSNQGLITTGNQSGMYQPDGGGPCITKCAKSY